MNTMVVNCYAGPGAGKTTCAWEVASQLKKKGINTEYVSEYAKELVWEGKYDVLENQEHLFAEQAKRLERLRGKVEVIVTDSPILMSHIYGRNNSTDFTMRIDDEYKKYYNFNLFIKRGDTFQQAGRIQNLEESKALDRKIMNMLKEKNIYFGVREHAMSSILNGLSLVGYRAYGATFLAFSDYMRPAMRLACMMHLPVTYIFTHDSISVGEDGPTHQPIEQLNTLRNTINLDVYRPCDANEVAGVYKIIMSSNDNPKAIVLTKSPVKCLENTSINNVKYGGYIVKKEQRQLDGILISSGEELHQAIEISDRLFTKGFDLRVVSMPSLNTFLKQTDEYIDEILPVEKKKIVIEKAPSVVWNKLIFNDKYIISQEEYGASGKKDDVLKKYGFDTDSLEKKVENLIK